MRSRQLLSRTAAFCPAAAWYLIIWHFSAQPATVSGALSDGLLYRLLEVMSEVFREQSVEEKEAIVRFLSFFVRKAAHMFLYFVLTGLLLLALYGLSRGFWLKAGISLGLCGLLAAVDELHQRFVPGRSGALQDVAVDLTGGAVFLLLCWLVRCVRLAYSGSTGRIERKKGCGV